MTITSVKKKKEDIQLLHRLLYLYICSTVITVAFCEAWIASIRVLFTVNLSDIAPEFFTVVMFVTN